MFHLDLQNYTCYYGPLNPDGECVNALTVNVTIGQCCCGNDQSRYGHECKACPAAGSGKIVNFLIIKEVVQRCLIKSMLLKMSPNLRENICVRAYFLTTACNVIKGDFDTGVFL